MKWFTRRSIIAAAILSTAVIGSAMAENFDKLSPDNRKEMQARFEKEVWPLFQRGGKDSCLGCHAGKVVSALRMSGQIEKDFPMLVKDGFFVPGDPGSLLSRIADKNPKRRMPPPKFTPWTKEEIAVLKAFEADLEKRQGK